MDWDLGQPDLTDHDKSNFSFYLEDESAVVRKVGEGDRVSSCLLPPKTGPLVDSLIGSVRSECDGTSVGYLVRGGLPSSLKLVSVITLRGQLAGGEDHLRQDQAVLLRCVRIS